MSADEASGKQAMRGSAQKFGGKVVGEAALSRLTWQKEWPEGDG